MRIFPKPRSSPDEGDHPHRTASSSTEVADWSAQSILAAPSERSYYKLIFYLIHKWIELTSG
jgi:hypothetical protein